MSLLWPKRWNQKPLTWQKSNTKIRRVEKRTVSTTAKKHENRSSFVLPTVWECLQNLCHRTHKRYACITSHMCCYAQSAMLPYTVETKKRQRENVVSVTYVLGSCCNDIAAKLSACTAMLCALTLMYALTMTDRCEMSNASAPQLPLPLFCSNCMCVCVRMWVNENRILNRSLLFVRSRSLFRCLFSLQWQQRADRVPFRFRFLFTTNTCTHSWLCEPRRCMHYHNRMHSTNGFQPESHWFSFICVLCAPHILFVYTRTHTALQLSSTHANHDANPTSKQHMHSCHEQRKQKNQSRMHSFRHA